MGGGDTLAPLWTTEMGPKRRGAEVPYNASPEPIGRFKADYNVDTGALFHPQYPEQKKKGEKAVYDKDELQNLLTALNRIGVFDLATPPEVFRPNPTTTYAGAGLPYTLPEGTPLQF